MLTPAQPADRFLARRRAASQSVEHALPKNWPNSDSSQLVDAGGSRWHVQRMGSGPKLLLIHGTASSTHTWRTLSRMLAADFDVLSMDLPGHGYSERLPDGSMALTDLASGLHALLRRVDFEPQYIAGHSAGAAIAVRMALDGSVRPDCIVGLNPALLPFGGVLSALFAPMARLFSSTKLMPKLVCRRARDIGAVRRVLRGTGSNIDEQGVRLYQSLLQREQHVAAVLAMMASWRLEPLLQSMPSLDARLCLVVGECDSAVPPGEAAAVASVVPRARVIRLAGCGHLAHEERPERVAHLIRQCVVPGRDKSRA